MNAKLLEKIEELTLYVIQLNKDVKQLGYENKELKKNNRITEQVELEKEIRLFSTNICKSLNVTKVKVASFINKHTKLSTCRKSIINLY